ncbi:MAG: hypothetical protein PHV97_02655 [Candidatus Omnitrophica bacterium]|nr:hypothetical protein [Candidatus Omnitrophota bacterium]
MRKNAEFFKIVIVAAILMMASGSLFCLAASLPESTENADAGVALQNDAPIYSGPYETGDLEELTAEDFEAFGVEPEDPQDQYRQYRKMLEQPPAGILVPYKLRIVDRDLTLDDFFGFNVSTELSQARYDGYLTMNPATADGHTIRYVYVYHSPVERIDSGISAS